MKYDIIIIGSGISGLYAAYNITFDQENLSLDYLVTADLDKIVKHANINK